MFYFFHILGGITHHEKASCTGAGPDHSSGPSGRLRRKENTAGTTTEDTANTETTDAPETTDNTAETGTEETTDDNSGAVVVDLTILKEADDSMLNTYSMIAVNPEALSPTLTATPFPMSPSTPPVPTP